MYRAILSGFETLEQVKAFLDWFEGQGEQDEGLQMLLKDRCDIDGVTCDVKTGMIEHDDGFEYIVNIWK